MKNSIILIKKMIRNNRLLYHVLRPVTTLYHKISGIYMRTGIFYIRYYLRSCGVVKKDSVMEKLRNIHKDRRIFIVATGPSLKISDLEWLKDNGEITISCNGIFKLFDKTDWRPDYYILDDYYLYEDYKKKKENLEMEKIAINKVLLSEPVRKSIDYQYDDSKIGFFPICYYDHWFTKKSSHFKYNRDMPMGHFDMYTVTNAAINLAHYMGAEEIILLGVDCNFSQVIQHSGEEENNTVDYKDAKEMEDAQKTGYRHIVRAFRNEKTKIFNATRGGNLELFPRKSMDEIMND